MNFSASNITLWSAILQLGIISSLLLIGNILRRKISLVNKSLLPVAVIAGFILLGLKEFNILQINTTFMEGLTYHMTGIGFIALSLRAPNSREMKAGSSTAKSAGVKSGMIIVSTYLIQAVVGLTITIILGYTFMPDLFKAAGILLPLGFGQGPGQAYNIGTTYQALGFFGGSSFGLAIASMGFIWASIGGAFYMMALVKRKKLTLIGRTPRNEALKNDVVEDEGEIPLTEAIDKFTIQIALIFVVYLATYLFSYGATELLAKATFLGNLANTVSTLIWGFNFLIGSSIALLVNTILAKLRKHKFMSRQYQNNYMLNRISGTAFDLMIAAAISSIVLADLKALWIPLILMTIAGGIVTILYLKYISKIVYPDYYNEGFFSMFGMLTGTISTGVLLLREIDPNFRSPAANNLVMGSSSAILMGFPMLLMVGIAPNSTETLFIIMGLCVAYGLVLNVLIHKKRKK